MSTQQDTFKFLDMSSGIHSKNISKLIDSILVNLDKKKYNVLPLTPYIENDTSGIFMIDIDKTFGFDIEYIIEQIEVELLKWYGIDCSLNHYITFLKKDGKVKYHIYYYDIILIKDARNYISNQINKRLNKKPVLDILSCGIRIDCFNKFKKFPCVQCNHVKCKCTPRKQNGKYLSNSRYTMLDSSIYDRQFFERIWKFKVVRELEQKNIRFITI